MSPLHARSTTVIIEARASVEAIRVGLIGLGAEVSKGRSVALLLRNHLLLLAADLEDPQTTTIALGGDDPVGVAHWLVGQFADAIQCRIHGIDEGFTATMRA